jgi:hypothetical protein
VKKAAGAAAIGAVLCAAVLAGCQSHTAASQPDGVVPAGASISSTIGSTSSSSATYPAAPGGASAGTVPGGGPAAASTSNIDSDLNTINQQLNGLDSALAKATQSPPDGD